MTAIHVIIPIIELLIYLHNAHVMMNIITLILYTLVVSVMVYAPIVMEINTMIAQIAMELEIIEKGNNRVILKIIRLISIISS